MLTAYIVVRGAPQTLPRLTGASRPLGLRLPLLSILTAKKCSWVQKVQRASHIKATHSFDRNTFSEYVYVGLLPRVKVLCDILEKCSAEGKGQKRQTALHGGGKTIKMAV